MPVFAEIEDALCGLAASRDRHALAGPPRRHLTGTRSAKAARRSGIPSSEEGPADRSTRRWRSASGYGIPVAPWQVAADADGAVQAANRLGYPVALKVLWPPRPCTSPTSAGWPWV
jgi:hypothetical protein